MAVGVKGRGLASHSTSEFDFLTDAVITIIKNSRILNGRNGSSDSICHLISSIDFIHHFTFHYNQNAIFI
jgi:hypothetical protein